MRSVGWGALPIPQQMEVFMRRLLLSGLMVLAFSVTAFAGVDVSKLQLPGDITQAQADTVIKALSPKPKSRACP